MPSARPIRIQHVDLHRGWGGGQSQLLLLARELAALGHEQAIVALEGGALAGRAAAEGFHVLELRRRSEIDPRAVLALRALAARFRPHVLHAHDPHGHAIAALAGRLLRPRPAVVAHRRVDSPIRRHPPSRWKYRRGADRLIAVSRHVESVLLAGGAPPERVVVLHDAVGRPSSVRTEPPLRARIGAPAGAPLVVTFASTAARKDHPTLIDAAARLRPRDPPTRWVVLGGAGASHEGLRTRVRARGLAERLHYVGFLADGRAYLPDADAFALTSKTEALGSSILEAMAAGVPVVATRAGGIPEIVVDGATGLLAPVGDPAAVARAIDRLLDDRGLARRLAEAARAGLAAFDPRRAARNVVATYDLALAEFPDPTEHRGKRATDDIKRRGDA
jgi:glycosyltransferase involved in cell wall biosynthesis